MKIGIISDSHDHLDNINKCVAIFKDMNVEYIVHLGDYVNPNSVRSFIGLKLVGIFGNNDGDKFRLMHAFSDINGKITGDFHEFDEDNLKFACYHGTETQIRDALIDCQKYDVVLCGHSHECEKRAVGKTLVLNPGSAHGFGDSGTILIFDTGTKEAQFIKL